MTLPFPLPPWLPWWVPIVVLVPVLLYVLVFLLVPFSVFGLKGRLDAIDARLDELQGEIRQLVPRLPQVDEEKGYNAVYSRRLAARPPGSPEPPRGGVPVAPAARTGEQGPRPPAAEEAPRRSPPAGPSREEPRLDWPR